jgi:hypothetical protein
MTNQGGDGEYFQQQGVRLVAALRLAGRSDAQISAGLDLGGSLDFLLAASADLSISSDPGDQYAADFLLDVARGPEAEVFAMTMSALMLLDTH